MPFLERQATLHQLYNSVAAAADCHRDTAKRNIAKALRKGRYTDMVSRWGGPREGAGWPKGRARKVNSNDSNPVEAGADEE